MTIGTMFEEFNVLTAEHKALFPGSWTRMSRDSLNGKTLIFESTLFNPEVWAYGYKQNDPMHVIFMIECISDNHFKAKLCNGLLSIKPTEKDKHLMFTNIKCMFRKIEGDAEKILKAIRKWQDKRLALVISNKSQIKNIENTNLKDI